VSPALHPSRPRSCQSSSMTTIFCSSISVIRAAFNRENASSAGLVIVVFSARGATRVRRRISASAFSAASTSSMAVASLCAKILFMRFDATRPRPPLPIPPVITCRLARPTHELASVRMCAYLGASHTIVTWLTTLSRLTGIATGCLMTQRATVAGVPLRLPSDPRSSIGWQVFSAPRTGPFDELSRDK
jgi:hypothetical protein